METMFVSLVFVGKSTVIVWFQSRSLSDAEVDVLFVVNPIMLLNKEPN